MIASMPKLDYFTGLDLGQARDFTALAVLERTTVPDPQAPGRMVGHYAVRHLERFPLGTAYTAVCTRVASLFAGPPLADSTLVVDQTGVGRPVIDLLRRTKIQARLRPVTITAGHRASLADGGGWLVPKKELVSTLQVLLAAQRLKVAPTLADAPTLVRELLQFQVKVTRAAHETFGSWRDGQHDDLVLAVAVAAWQAERCPSRASFAPHVLGIGSAWRPGS
jgi:hypothetical protein